MPNIIRRSRPPRSEPRSNRPCDSGTHLTSEERRHILSLSQRPGCSQRAIASSLKLPRTTVQSVIYAITGRPTKRQRCKRTHTAVQNSALSATASSSAVYTPLKSCITADTLSDIQLPSVYHLTNATSTVHSITMSTSDGYPSLPPQPAIPADSWDNINSSIRCNLLENGSHYQFANFSIEHFDLDRFDPHKGANVGIYLLPNVPKPMPIEPRIIYESVASCKLSFPTL
ncbi:hypothetical protein GQ44DRAFT_722540 [Phaeosphaeriaceae sp. PMI808]|nr:hypothetical protein GQ44DRAFT_722540 [Phaeosphaeriaceae sp. PMI808]